MCSKCNKLQKEVYKEVHSQNKLSYSYKKCLEERAKLQNKFIKYKKRLIKYKSTLNENNDSTINIEQPVLDMNDKLIKNVDF